MINKKFRPNVPQIFAGGIFYAPFSKNVENAKGQNLKTAFSRLRIAYFLKMCNDNNPNEKIETIIDYV